VKRKLAPRYVGPYRICQRIGKLAYKVELPEELTGVHPVFHGLSYVSAWSCQTKKYTQMH
jgi:hypothetical protein